MKAKSDEPHQCQSDRGEVCAIPPQPSPAALSPFSPTPTYNNRIHAASRASGGANTAHRLLIRSSSANAPRFWRTMRLRFHIAHRDLIRPYDGEFETKA
jgi:hypothetical protein